MDPAAFRMDEFRAALSYTSGHVDDDRDKNGATSLMWAACNGRAEAVKLLLRAGANPNAVDGVHEGTALHYALESFEEDNSAVINLLMEAGADPNVRTTTGLTPLHVLACYGRPNDAAALLSYAMRVQFRFNGLDVEGFTPHARAVANGHARLAGTLAAMNKLP